MAKFANFKIIVEIEKLKIHVEGDREIAPEIASNVAQQITSVIQPSGLLEAPQDEHSSNPASNALAAPSVRRTRRTRSSARVGNPLAAIRQCGVPGLGFPGGQLFQPLEGSGF
jgi:hypothetical protein